MVDIHREGKVAARDQLPSRDTRPTRPACAETEAGTAEGRRRTAPGESALVKLPELLQRGRHKTQAQPSLRLCGEPENLNVSGLGLGTARNSGPAPYRAAWSLSRVDGEST